MTRKRRKRGLGSANEDHARRAHRAAQDVSSKSRVSVDSATQGLCTRAFDALNQAQEAYGELRANVHAGAAAPTKHAYDTMVNARHAFFRRCVVPQR